MLKVKEYSAGKQLLPKNISKYFGADTPATYASTYDGKVLVLEEIEKEGSSSSASSRAETAPDRYPSNPSKISIKDLLDLVKGDARKYIPEPSGELYSADTEDETEALPPYGELPGRELMKNDPAAARQGVCHLVPWVLRRDSRGNPG